MAATAAGGPGAISDAWAGFAAQAEKRLAGPAPDANVAVAYALGWAVGEAMTGARWGTTGHLAEVPGLSSPAARWKLLVDQLAFRAKRLQAHLKDAGPGFDLADQVAAAAGLGLDPGSPADAAALAAKRVTADGLHAGILGVLWSVEQPLGQAYLLGQEMEQMCATPAVDGAHDVRASVKAHSEQVHALLSTLASVLPANAAHACANSLRLWWASLRAGGAETAQDLLEQGQRWREVLAGDVAAQDRLRLSDYVAAADGVAGKLRETAWQVAKRFWAWLLVALVLVGGGVALIVIGTKGALGAGITSVLAAFGLTWKGIGEFFGRAAAQGEQKLWDAEIDWAIAYRFTVLRPPGKSELRRQARTLNWDRPTKEHMRRYTQWKTRWPDVPKGLPD